MKSLLPAVLLSLLFLSITYSEVAKDLKCYQRHPDQDSVWNITCPSRDDVVCVTAINKDDSSVAFRDCGIIEEVESVCQSMTTIECKTCNSYLCNTEDLVKKLKCNKRQRQDKKVERLECYKGYAGFELEKRVCSGDDVVCLTAINKDDSKVLFRNCGPRKDVESECQTLSYIECKTCNTALCNILY